MLIQKSPYTSTKYRHICVCVVFYEYEKIHENEIPQQKQKKEYATELWQIKRQKYLTPEHHNNNDGAQQQRSVIKYCRYNNNFCVLVV